MKTLSLLLSILACSCTQAVPSAPPLSDPHAGPAIQTHVNIETNIHLSLIP